MMLFEPLFRTLCLVKLRKGDLVGVYVYKFDVVGQKMLLAYEWDPTQRLLIRGT